MTQEPMQARGSKRLQEHTPGPWTYRKAPKMGAIDGCEIHTVNEVQHTSVFSGPEFTGYAYSEPNAKLMAAVPDLLAALEEIAKGEGAYSRDPLTHAENTIDAMKALASAAIQKARGA